MSRNAHLKAVLAGTICTAVCLCLSALQGAGTQAQTPAPGVTNAPRARVVVVEDPEATYDLQPVPDRVQAMVDRAITNLTGKPTVSAAWLSLVSTQDTVGIKVYSTPGPNSGTRRAVAAAVAHGLLDAGLPTNHVIVWDKRAVDLRLAGYYELEERLGIRVLGSEDAGYDEKTFYEAPLLGMQSPSDPGFNEKDPAAGRKSLVSKLVSEQLTKIINIPPLMHHNTAGVYGNLYSLTMGSVDNTLRFERSAVELNKAVPEIYALPVFGGKAAGDKVVLSIVDGLICQYEGQLSSLLHYSTNLNQLRFSRDPVALDVLSLEEINRQCAAAGMPVLNTNLDLLHNATLLEIGVSDPKLIDVEKLP